MTKGTVRDVYIKYLEHNPSAAPKFHAWVDPTAPSLSPPLSEPAPSSSRSSGAARPRKKRKTYKDPSRVTDAKLKETIDAYEQREDLLNKITTFKRKRARSP
jgi:hypothetical protein